MANKAKIELIITIDSGHKVKEEIEVPYRRASDLELIKHLHDSVLEQLSKWEQVNENSMHSDEREF